MPLKQYQVDAFASKAFGGNPAAVIVTEQALSESLMQSLAAENNLSETAYVYPEGNAWRIRWFTPTVEVDLCGHATLASAWVLATEYGLLKHSPTGVDLVFKSRGGELKVCVTPSKITLDFPSQKVSPVPLPAVIRDGLGIQHLSANCFKADINNGNYVVVLPSEDDVAALNPNMAMLAEVDDGGVIATARSRSVDFVSRFFGPYYGIPEDPVTGSAHCALAPYWGTVLGQKALQARQISTRGGELECLWDDERVLISGTAVTVNSTEWRVDHA